MYITCEELNNFPQVAAATTQNVRPATRYVAS